VPPRLLVSTAAFFGRPLAETCRLVADAGYDAIEVMVTKDPASQDPGQMKIIAASFGLEIGAIHAPALLITRRVWGTDPIGKIGTAIEVADAVGAPLVVMHPPYRWQRSYREWLRADLPGIEDRTGMTVAIENMFPVHVGSRPLMLHADQDLDGLDDIAHLVLDTSHAAVARHDLVEVRRRFAERLRHVHLSDNAGKGWDSHLPPGEGVLPLAAFAADLAASGFGGAVTLEVDLRGRGDDPTSLHAILVSMREQVEAWLR